MGVTEAVGAGTGPVRRDVVGVPAVGRFGQTDAVTLGRPLEAGGVGQVVKRPETGRQLAATLPAKVAGAGPVEAVPLAALEEAPGAPPRFGAPIARATIAPAGEVPTERHLLVMEAVARPPGAGRLGPDVEGQVAVAPIQAIPADAAAAAEPAETVADANGAEAHPSVAAPVRVVVARPRPARQGAVDREKVPVRGDRGRTAAAGAGRVG